MVRNFFSFVGMGGFGVFPSHPLVWIRLVFWFGLFFSCSWDGWGGIFNCKSMQRYVGVDGMGMGRYVAVDEI